MNEQKVIFGENASLADYVARIESARVYDVARVTSLDRARRLSDRLGANVLLKRGASCRCWPRSLRQTSRLLG